jgi:hypothetical protein
MAADYGLRLETCLAVLRQACGACVLCDIWQVSLLLAPAQGERDERRRRQWLLPRWVASGEGSGIGVEGEDKGAWQLTAGE